MRLGEFVERYTLERCLSDGHRELLSRAAVRFDRWHGRPASLSHLSDDTVNRWLLSLEAEGLRPRTVKGLRSRIMALWRAAYADRLLNRPPRRVRMIRPPATLPEAWEAAQLRSLLLTAGKLKGAFRFHRVRRAAFWRAFILAAYDSGLRISDLLRLELAQIGSDGALIVSQKKTGGIVLCRLRRETVAAIEATYPPIRARPFGDVLKQRSAIQEFGKIVNRAGLTGSSKWLRRTSATLLAAHHPEAVQAHLGHRTPGLAWRHYVDPRIVQTAAKRPLPPKIA